ncbi:MAG: hypothetical protein KR126chlam6_00627 [Candidatus Anoxychlamydiales bacterium]|nr:hypothetical protein [Candidatus Anoxychlamydiales bacterium]
MSDSTSGIPPSGADKPKPDKMQPIKPKPQDLVPPGQDDDYEYMGFTFANKKDYDTFKYKFLSNMANLMMAQIRSDNENMIKALKKMREQNQ